MKVMMLTERLRRRGFWLLTLLAAAAVVLSACDLIGTDDDEQQSAQQQAQSAEQGQAEAEQEQPAAPAAAAPADDPPQSRSAPPPPVARGGGAGEQAYSIVFPSIAQVSAGGVVATGLVIREGLVLVDGVALGGAAAADVRLSNGETLEALPIVDRDALTGLAYLGPLDAGLVRLLPGARLGDGESVRPGASVYAIGYGAFDAADAAPIVFSGVVSGFLEWEPGQRTILRTDIDLPPGSGGVVLVDATGTVIGVAPASVAGDGLYISTGDLARSLNTDPADRLSAPPPAVMTAMEHTLTLGEGQESVTLYAIDAPPNERLRVTVRTQTASLLQVVDNFGTLVHEANLVSGSTIVALDASASGAYEIVIGPAAMMEEGSEPAVYEVTSSAPLTVIAEADEPAPLHLDEQIVGRIDIAGDVDTFHLPVLGGGVYEVRMQSFLLDSYVMVEGAGINADDDDSGGGLFNLDSALTIAPLVDGMVQLSVSDRLNADSGTYLLTVTQISGPTEAEAAAESETAMADEEDAMMMVVMLPAPLPPPVMSLRGIGGEDGLRATLLGLNSQSVGNGLLVDDQDGAFEIIVSVLGSDGALGRLTVTNIEGSIVVEGRVLVSCTGSGQCLAQAVFVSNETAGGPWVVELSADAPGIAEWQIEVERHE